MIRSKYTIEKYIPPAKTLHERDAMKENCLKAFEHVTNWRVIAYIAVMGFSRVYLGVHTVTDVIAGYFAGVFVLSIGWHVMAGDSCKK